MQNVHLSILEEVKSIVIASAQVFVVHILQKSFKTETLISRHKQAFMLFVVSNVKELLIYKKESHYS